MNPTTQDLPKYISIITEFSEKLESHINKKYRPFLKILLAQLMAERNKNPNGQKISLGSEIIAFKLGIESKSTKCIEMTLGYLYRLFSQGFIDIGEPNYCEDFVITQANIQNKKCQKYEREMRHEIVKWLQPLVHFKNPQINNLVLKNYQYLTSQPILPSIIEISFVLQNELCFNLLHSYFSYRLYLFEQVYYYTKSELAQFKYVPANERISGQINNALDREEGLENLVECYVKEIVAKVVGDGGKYGFCVVCQQPAEYFCKVTKASLCGLECKKKHLEVAEKQYKNYNESLAIFKSIKQSNQILAKTLTQKQSPFLFSLMASIIEKPYLFQLVKPECKAQLHKYLPGILYRAYESKNEHIIETLYFMISALAKWWPTECLAEIEFFMKEHILKILGDKKPGFRHLILVFKSLDKIFDHGRSIVELYVNLDCEINHFDVIGNVLFQLSKIAQDKFANASNYNRQQKITIKNSCMTLFQTFVRSLNDFRRNYPNTIKIAEIDRQKMRKSDLQKFMHKFNQHWSQGLKCLFNLNLVGLDSNHEIINIIMSLAGLNKKMIDQMLFEKRNQAYLEIFMNRLGEQDEPLILKLLSFYKFVPMTENNSISLLRFAETFGVMYKMPDLLGVVKKITSVLMKAETVDQFRNKIKQHVPEQSDFRYLYLRMLTARKPETSGKPKRLYTFCLSQSYLEPLSSQLTLLQIPLSYMLETSYDADRILNLIRELVPVCRHSNWIALLVKHSGIDQSTEQLLTPYNIKIIKGILDIITLQADFIVDWLTILTFLANIYYLLSLSHPVTKKYLTQNKTTLSQQLSPQAVQNCLINSSLKCGINFSKFMNGVLTIAREHLVNDQIMMLQKFFHVLDANLEKYLGNFQEIFGEFGKFVGELKSKTSTQTYIYIVDMLKQLLLKVLKSSLSFSQEIPVRHLQIFHLILSKNPQNKEIGDFVLNSLSTIVVYNYNLQPRAWKQIIRIVDEQASIYSYQASVIIRKILNQHMKGIEDESQNLLGICFKLIKAGDQKSSIQAIHDIKIVLDLMKAAVAGQRKDGRSRQNSESISQKQQIVEQKPQQPSQQQTNQAYNRDKATLKRLLLLSITKLTQYIGQSFSQAIAQTLFLLFGTKIGIPPEDQPLLSEQELNSFISNLFEKLEQIQLGIGERIMNQTLYWSSKNRNKGIIFNLEKIIVGKYTNLSITAMKCIKTYIQMANLKSQKQWEDVQGVLLRIIDATQVQRFFNIEQKPQQNIQHQIHNLIHNTVPTAVPLQTTLFSFQPQKFIHECRIQMLGVELLPNHKHCLEVLERVYSQKVKFNDMVGLRVGLWRRGELGRDWPPDLLNLEQTVSNRIMAIHVWENDTKNILEFCYRILEKYLTSTQTFQSLLESQPQILSTSNPQNLQLNTILLDYWNKRRQPLTKLISYIMPKLNKYCETPVERKRLLEYFVRALPVMENKEAVIRVVVELSDRVF